MRKTINQTYIEGYVYSHKLECKTSGAQSKNPGTPFIKGSLDIATNEDCTNTITVNFTYVTELTKNGQKNRNYEVLSKIINRQLFNVIEDGKEKATKVKINSAFGLNEWFDKESGELVSRVMNDGGFITVISSFEKPEDQRNSFKADMLITKVNRKEANEEKEEPERMIVKGFVFNFRKEILPIEFTVYNTVAMDYFEDHDFTMSPLFTQVGGSQDSLVFKKTEIEESAFGDDIVNDVTRYRKALVIKFARKTPYEWDSEEDLTALEVKEAIANRELMLATKKKEREEYLKSVASAPASPAPAPTPVAAGGFNW